MRSWLDDGNSPSTSTSPSSHTVLPQVPGCSTSSYSGNNVCRLLAWREISPRAKNSSRRLWREASKCNIDSSGPKCESTDAKLGLVSWVEAESLRHLSAKYCPLVPPPRSTIASAFSPDGRTLASTHGDHTVKIIDCQTGSCLKVLTGHRRTPWVVRFHPVHPEILASGSLDHEVRLWDANTAECIGSRDFYRPIASIAFHAQGELLAVASGHKLYIWHYNRRGETSSPSIVLKTRRSLRAVHFHPYAAPFLLTAEVNDLDSPDSPMTIATCPGYLRYPPPTVLFANIHSSVRSGLDARVPLIQFPFLFWPTVARDDGRILQHANRTFTSTTSRRVESSAPIQPQSDPNLGNQHDFLVSHMEMSPVIPSSSHSVPEGTVNDSFSMEMDNMVYDSAMDVENSEGLIGDVQQSTCPVPDTMDAGSNVPPLNFQSSGVCIRTTTRPLRPGVEVTSGIHLLNLSSNAGLQLLLRSAEVGQLDRTFTFSDPMSWELPFLQGWLMGQSHAGIHPILPINDGAVDNSSGFHGTDSDTLASDLGTQSMATMMASTVMPTGVSRPGIAGQSVMPTGVSQPRIAGQSGLRSHSSRSRSIAPNGSGEGAFINVTHDESDPQPVVSRIESELATSLAAAAAAELPCTVKLRIWPHDIKDPCAPLDAERCRLTIPHAVLCSEMGAHFSPCGRFLAACVACMLPHMEADPGLQSQAHNDVPGTATSPTRHPISAHQVMYELRIYSLEDATFGLVLASRAIRAAHCLTSIQFSPTSEHILLAYGRRHSSLLRSIVIDGETTMPIYTILELDEDEIQANVSCVEVFFSRQIELICWKSFPDFKWPPWSICGGEYRRFDSIY
ncbi:uncharacterized protein LOC122092396 isoform X2 [Macadamia integrifolia]|uniref:uncharacterized protein LOC122092396 isoform X2 n=1 Tax=Macadamia integrifolia TaxID=60698 RepID=UPI001C4EAFFD|nr:uncharacterized protein LOC122092396 isoform X2 [Macadamia integrifolia]